jgi:hypothetical protein
MKRKLTPQDKKILSYATDGRNTVAESRSIANKAISKKKSQANQSYRQSVEVKLQEALKTGADDSVDIFIPKIGSNRFKKIPDAPLAVYVEARLAVRTERGMNDKDKSSPLLQAAKAKTRSRPYLLKGSLQSKKKIA